MKKQNSFEMPLQFASKRDYESKLIEFLMRED